MPDHELHEWSALSRSITETDRVRHTPPPGLFDQISAEIANDAPSLTLVQDETRPMTPQPAIDLSQERARRAPSVARKRRRQVFIGSLAAACALVIGFSVIGGDDNTETFVAEATNTDLPEAFGGAATAIVSGDEALTLSLELSTDLPSDEPVELWLIKPDLSDMVSLGLVEPGTTEWEVPAGIEPTEYSLVDLSIEPDDGDATHSGRSILRGALEERDI